MYDLENFKRKTPIFILFSKYHVWWDQEVKEKGVGGFPRPCPVAQSVEQLGRSDSDTELAGVAGSIPERGRSNFAVCFLPFLLPLRRS